MGETMRIFVIKLNGVEQRLRMPAYEAPVVVTPEPEVEPIDDPEGIAARSAIKKRLKMAGLTLKRTSQPKEIRGLVGAVSAMPTVVHDKWDAAVWRRKKARPVPPTKAEIDNLNKVLEWLLWLDADTRPVVFGCMVASRRKVAEIDPMMRSHANIGRIFNSGISQILGRLIDNGTKYRNTA